MKTAFRLLVVSALILNPGNSIAVERFDGHWQTRLTCPPKGNTEGYTWNFPSVIAQFKETEGTGTRSEGLGIVGRTCTFEFVKQPPTPHTDSQ